MHDGELFSFLVVCNLPAKDKKKKKGKKIYDKFTYFEA